MSLLSLCASYTPTPIFFSYVSCNLAQNYFFISSAPRRLYLVIKSFGQIYNVHAMIHECVVKDIEVKLE